MHPTMLLTMFKQAAERAGTTLEAVLKDTGLVDALHVAAAEEVEESEDTHHHHMHRDQANYKNAPKRLQNAPTDS
jgi:hypothetical protein